MGAGCVGDDGLRGVECGRDLLIAGQVSRGQLKGRRRVGRVASALKCRVWATPALSPSGW